MAPSYPHRIYRLHCCMLPPLHTWESDRRCTDFRHIFLNLNEEIGRPCFIFIDQGGFSFTRFGAEVTAFVRQFAGAALPDLLVPADGAVIAAQVIVAGAACAGQGVLGALDTGAALTILGCFAVWVLAPLLHRSSALNATILTLAAVISQKQMLQVLSQALVRKLLMTHTS